MKFGQPFGTTFGQYCDVNAYTDVPIRYKVPANLTPEGIALEKAYYEALGRFVQIFAEVEKVTAETFWHYAKASPTVAKVVFAGVQIEHAATLIKQLAAATNAPQSACDDLEDVLQQLGIIRGVRNDILHYGTTNIAEGRATVSNAWKAKSEPVEFPISAEELTNMQVDLRKIIAHLEYQHLERPHPQSQLALATLAHALRSPWQYKHPAPPQSKTKKAQSQPHRKRGLKPPHRLQSLPE